MVMADAGTKGSDAGTALKFRRAGPGYCLYGRHSLLKARRRRYALFQKADHFAQSVDDTFKLRA